MNNLPFFDGHNDTLTKMYFDKHDLKTYLTGNEKLHIDLPMAKKIHFIGGLFSIFIPPLKGSWNPQKEIKYENDGYKFEAAPYLDKDYSIEIADKLIMNVYELENYSKGAIKIVKNYKDLNVCRDTGKLALVIHFEGAEMIKCDLSNLQDYYDKGLRSIGFVWSRVNDFASGVPFYFPSTGDAGPGLTDLGKNLVKHCNELGIMIDLSHMTEKGFFDVAELSGKPLAVSHCGVNRLCRSSRNLTDEQIKTVKDSNGVVGIYYVAEMLNNSGKLGDAQKRKSGLIVQHIDYIVQKYGVDYVALGSDFDGCTLPGDFENILDVGKIFTGLKSLGYQKDDLEKIAYKNWFRLLDETWE